MDGTQVVITLIPIHSQPNLPFSRSFVLSEASPIISLGRSSKREGRNREPACDNGWFDSRVMSRDHAELSISQKNKDVYIQDSGSTHGTWLNNLKLIPDEKTPLLDGDVLRFGVNVDRGDEEFPALSVRCGISWSENECAVPTSLRTKSWDHSTDYVSSRPVEEMPPRNLKFFLEAALNDAPRPTSSSNTFCVPEDDSDAEEIPAVAPTSEEIGAETTISFNQTLPKLHDIINLDEEQTTDLKQHDTDISRPCCPWEPEPVEDQVGQESDLDNVLSDSSDEGSDLENSQSASSDTSQSEAVRDQAKLVEQPENSINDISDEDHEHSDSDEAECIDPRILAQKNHTELSRCDKPVERLIGEKSSQHTSSTRPTFSQRFPPPESLYEINYHPRTSLETENLSGSRGSIEQPPYFGPTVSSCHGYRDGPFSWSHQSFPNSFAPSSIFIPQSIPGPSVPMSEESPPEWHDYANEKAIKKETIVGNPLPTLKRTASEMESSDTLQEVQTLGMAHSASAKPEIDAISQSQVVCAITSALSEAGEESESERPTKRVKHNSPPSTNLTRYTATAVISALLGGLGTIALLAALPAEYFQ